MATISLLHLHAAPAAGYDAPFDMLADCHDRVRRTLALLRRLQAHLGNQGAQGAQGAQSAQGALGADASARSAAADVLRYFDQAAPAHHEDEERHVLPRLRSAGDAALAELAERLHAEHQLMAKAWMQARPALAHLAAGEPWSGAESKAAFVCWDAFAALYDSHLQAEDEVAFPQAAQGLDPAVLRAMGEEMARRRGVVSNEAALRPADRR